MRQLYLDQDGVLADFDRHYKETFGLEANKNLNNVSWDLVRAVKDFYLYIPPMADLPDLWSYVTKHFVPIILTGVPSSIKEEASANKRAWVKRYLGSDIEVRCCLSREKYLHAQPGDILVDDWEKWKHLWLKADGIWITHTSAEETIKQLEQVR